jgi:hypothetical protein
MYSMVSGMVVYTLVLKQWTKKKRVVQKENRIQGWISII